MVYNEESFLQLSGLQHFAFCRRQWALIHVENQWAENFRTADGALLHEKAHNPDARESRGDLVITRGMRIHSSSLGLSGECDVLEFHRASTGIPLPGKKGLWQPFPVEYKRGEPEGHTDADSVQLCAQAMCVEEMLCVPIPSGALFYGQTRHRFPVEFTQELRERTAALAEEMHSIYQRGITPRVKPRKACHACSLKDICLPELIRKKAVNEYIRKHLEERE